MSDIETFFNTANNDQKKLIIAAANAELNRRFEHTMKNLDKFINETTEVDLSNFCKVHSRKEKIEKKDLKPKSDLIRLIADKDSQKFSRESVLEFIREKGYLKTEISALLEKDFEIQLLLTKNGDMVFKHGEIEIERDFEQLVSGAYPFKMFFSLISNTFKQKGVELKPFKDSLLANTLQDLREEIYQEMKTLQDLREEMKVLK
tara:strand:- start:3500 stop:4111 length:612 start_codon:yes stop_codon:yes gene_type:complete